MRRRDVGQPWTVTVLAPDGQFRERRFLNATPTDVQFDRELRIVIIENITNESLTPAKAVVLVRERLAKRFSLDGINGASLMSSAV